MGLEQIKRLAKEVSKQRTGNGDRWEEFVHLVIAAKQQAENSTEYTTIRDILDIGEDDLEGFKPSP